MKRQFITNYTSESFSKPIAIFSLLVDDEKGTSELAVCFVNALNFHHALEKIYVSKILYENAGWGNPHENVTNFKILKKYRSIEKGFDEFKRIPTNMTFKKYNKFVDKYFKGYEKTGELK